MSPFDRAKELPTRDFFVEPTTAMSSGFHCNVTGSTLYIDVRIFCADVIAAACEWLEEVGGSERFQANVGRFMRRHPRGLVPFLSGVPVFS